MAPGQKPFYIALGIVVVGGIAFIASRVRGAAAVSIPANVIVTTADTSGFRGYLLGAPSAPVEITEYADFGCPHCADFDQVQFPDINTRLIVPGKARLRFRDFPIEGANSRVAAHAAACANDQGHFWDVKEGLFRRQMEWVLQNNPMPVITEVAKATGLDVGAWTACMQSAKYAGRIQASYNEGSKLGVNSTPSFLINGRIYTSINADLIVQLVDSLGAAAPRSPGATTPLGGQ
jgi:protein-disulfide isomerase